MRDDAPATEPTPSIGEITVHHRSEADFERFGRAAYAAYARETMRSRAWEALPASQRRAWLRVVRAVFIENTR